MRKRYSIWNEFKRMQDQMDSIFDQFFSNQPYYRQNLLEGPINKEQSMVKSNYLSPICDFYETETDLITELEMPGVNKKNIQIYIDEEGIQVRAEYKTEVEQEDKKKGMYRLERNYSGYNRFFALPRNIDPDKATAEYKNGMLKITIPKTKTETSKRKFLEVK